MSFIKNLLGLGTKAAEKITDDLAADKQEEGRLKEKRLEIELEELKKSKGRMTPLQLLKFVVVFVLLFCLIDSILADYLPWLQEVSSETLDKVMKLCLTVFAF